MYLYSRAVLTNCHKFDGLQQQKVILSQCPRPEVLNQGVGMSVTPWKLLGRIYCMPLC